MPYERALSVEDMSRVEDQDLDFSDIPALGPDFWANAKVVVPDKPKTPLSLRIDADIVKWFRDQGRGYQTQINAVLRSYVDAQR